MAWGRVWTSSVSRAPCYTAQWGIMPRFPCCKAWDFLPLALHTVWYSHHKGHAGWFGETTPLPLFERFLQYAVQAPHLQVSTVLSGFMGSVEQMQLLAQYLPAGVCYACDPVMGDYPSGQYVSAAIVEAYCTALVPRATMLFPNLFELGVLSGTAISTLDAAREAAQQLLARYANLHIVVVTGVPVAADLHLLAVSRQQTAHTSHPVRAVSCARHWRCLECRLAGVVSAQRRYAGQSDAGGAVCVPRRAGHSAVRTARLTAAGRAPLVTAHGQAISPRGWQKLGRYGGLYTCRVI